MSDRMLKVRAALAVALLFVAAALVLIASSPGDAESANRVTYANYVQMTATGVVRFHPTQTGGGANGTQARRCQFVRVRNCTAQPITMLVYQAGPSPFSTELQTVVMSDSTNPGIWQDIFVAGGVDSINLSSAPGIGAGLPVQFWAWDEE